jgi:hypothetical protein
LKRHGLSTRKARLGLVAGYQAPPEPMRPGPEEPRDIEAERPGDLVQMDCFCIGRSSGTKGTLWQYTAIDVASSYVLAELDATVKNPSAKWTTELARRVALDPSGVRSRQVDRGANDHSALVRILSGRVHSDP